MSVLDLRVRFAPDDAELSRLHAAAFGGSSEPSTAPWSERLDRHALTWVGAFDDAALVGFVQVAWDGGLHAFLLDTVVHPDHQRRGIGRAVVGRAADESRNQGCAWLHVDCEPQLHGFYLDACGFRSTKAGLLDLRQ